MQDATQYIWTPPPDLVAQSNLTGFLRATGQQDYDGLASKADADPAWLMQEVFSFCDVRFYRNFDAMLDLSRGQPWARWCVGGTTNIRPELHRQASWNRGVEPNIPGVGRRKPARTTLADLP
jgi:acetyl-CoA synthetase